MARKAGIVCRGEDEWKITSLSSSVERRTTGGKVSPLAIGRLRVAPVG